MFPKTKAKIDYYRWAETFTTTNSLHIWVQKECIIIIINFWTRAFSTKERLVITSHHSHSGFQHISGHRQAPTMRSCFWSVILCRFAEHNPRRIILELYVLVFAKILVVRMVWCKEPALKRFWIYWPTFASFLLLHYKLEYVCECSSPFTNISFSPLKLLSSRKQLRLFSVNNSWCNNCARIPYIIIWQSSTNQAHFSIQTDSSRRDILFWTRFPIPFLAALR